MAAGGSHIAVFIILGSLEERMQKLQSLQAARHEFFSALMFGPGWRNWSDFSLNHHMFLGYCCLMLLSLGC